MARILIMKNAQLVEAVPIIGDRTRIGREQLNQIRIINSTISRFHAEIHRRGLCYSLEDKQSTNGTRLNGSYLKEKQLLSDQDKILIGEFTLIFSLDDTDQPQRVKVDYIDSEDTAYDLRELV
jgi:pSer/pThr/pTyr-binding forkhead associated (FHA) protein